MVEEQSMGEIIPELQGVKYLLKFGKNGHLQQFAGGTLYCSNAVTFWGIEDNNKIKGQGDRLEASSVIYSQKVQMFDYQTGQLACELSQAKMIGRIDRAKHIPVFCMYAVCEDECDGANIRLSTKSKDTIRGHFPNADSVAIIANPSKFVENVVESIGTRIKTDRVHYFYIDEGIPTGDGRTAVDMRYFNYLMQDVPSLEIGKNKVNKFRGEYAFRVLFCKDVCFEGEKEFRFVLPDERIFQGTPYPVRLTEEIRIVNLEEFFGQDEVEIRI